MTIIDELREIGERARQNRAVAKWLKRARVISNHAAIYKGVPVYGHLTRLGARIYDLRPEDARRRADHNTHYHLIRAPKLAKKR